MNRTAGRFASFKLPRSPSHDSPIPMNAQRTAGIVLVTAGILGFVAGSVSFTTSEKVADVGPVEVETQEERSFPLYPIASGTAVVAGIALVGFSFRKSSSTG